MRAEQDSIKAHFKLDWPGFTLDVDLDLPGRGVTALFGHSGSGKTTLLRCLAGIQAPSAGSIHIAGVVLASDPLGAKSRLGFAVDPVLLPPALSGRQCLALFAGARGLAAVPDSSLALAEALAFDRWLVVVEILIGIIVVLSISNTLSMAVIERTGEIGTMMAMGVRRHSVLRLFIFEGLMLGVIGSVLGIFIGWLLSLAISAVGIPMPPSARHGERLHR